MRALELFFPVLHEFHSPLSLRAEMGKNREDTIGPYAPGSGKPGLEVETETQAMEGVV